MRAEYIVVKLGTYIMYFLEKRKVNKCHTIITISRIAMWS
jgi:hypothetical protein